MVALIHTILLPHTTDGAVQSAPAAPSGDNVPLASRPWDTNYLASLGGLAVSQPVQFELLNGEQAVGTLSYMETREGEVIYVTGPLTQPEKGRFFFQKQTLPGKAGDFFGVVEFHGSKRAYRIEPVGPGGSSALVQRRLDEVICIIPALTQPPEETGEIPPLDPSDMPDYPIPAYQDGIISLQSLPGATAVLYMDYRGGYTPTWGGISYEKPNVSNAQIRDVWKRVAEDYMPFNINVTTDIKVYERAPENSRQRCVVTPTTTAAPGAGGVAYLNSWNSTGDTPCWSFYSTGKSAAEVISHEVGHTLRLSHDGSPAGGYYGGHGSGAVGWAPIMGVGYYEDVSQWSKGEYADANNTQDDLSIIVTDNNAVDYRIDDTGATLAAARYLDIFTGGAATAEGVIETTGDADAFRFTTAGGTVSLRVETAGSWANLALEATLANSAGAIIASNNPQTTLTAGVTSSVPAGTYTFRVRGVGRNDPLTTGFTDYASLGYYSITGTVANAVVSQRFDVAENTPNGTLVGVIAPPTNSDNRVFVIQSGNTGGAFSIDNAGQLRVANASVLNYESLAANTQLPVRFELFLNITNLDNPSFTETNRRVVVSVLDRNEPPTAAGFSVLVFSGTAPGTRVGAITASDPDYYDQQLYAIVAGDPSERFRVNSLGEVLVAGPLFSTNQPSYQLQVRVTDLGAPVSLSVTSLVTVTVLANNSGFQPGSVACAFYTNISGATIANLTSSPSYPNNPAYEAQLATLETTNNIADNYGMAVRGYLIPPVTGNYTFWIATDDAGELWLSTSSNPAGISRIAYIDTYAAPRQWTKVASQKSAVRSLVAGTAYYLEVRQKEGGGGDNLAVAWSGPSQPGTNVIPGLFLAPYVQNYSPVPTGFSQSFRRDVFQGARLGRVTVKDANPGQAHVFTITSGNPAGLFGIDSEGWVRLADASTLQTLSPQTFNLQVQATDNGTPSRSGTANVTLTLVEAADLQVTALQREMFLNISGGTVANLTSNAKYPGRVDELRAMTDFTTPADVGENYGSRIRGYLTAPVDGDYIFYIASDDASQLKLSASENPAGAAVIASVGSWTDPNQWTKEAGQRSAARTLLAGQRYYIEAIHKEGGGGDHLSVAWIMPGTIETNIIPAAYLSPADINTPPTFPAQTLRVYNAVPGGTVIGFLTSTDSPLDSMAYRIVSGNTGDTFALDTGTGALRVENNTLVTNGSTASFSLTVEAQDSGLGGRYPLRVSTATVTVQVLSPTGPLVWSGTGSSNAWSDPGNWSGAAPAEGGRLIFGAPYQPTNVNNLLGSLAWVQITNNGFNLGGQGVTLAAGLTNAGNNAWSIPTTLAGAQTWLSSSGTLTVNGSVSNGGHSLSVATTGEMRLLGQLSGTGGLTRTGTNRLLMAGTHTYSGATVIQPATGSVTALEVTGDRDLHLGQSDLGLYGRMDLWNRNATIGALNGSSAGLLFANNGNRMLTVGYNQHSGTFAGVLQNSTWATGVTLGLTKVGTGSQTLSGNNTFSGLVLVEGGTLTAAHANALGNTNGWTVVSPGATLGVSGGLVFAEPVTLAGAGTDGAGALRNLSGLNTWNGRLTLAAPTTITVPAGRLTVGGVWDRGSHDLTIDVANGANLISSTGIGGTGALTKTGIGLLNLNASNTCSGPVQVMQGTLALSGANPLASANTIEIAAGATLSAASVPGGLTVSSTQTLTGAGLLSGNCIVNGSVRPGAGMATLTVSGSLVLNGVTSVDLAKTNTVATNDLISCTGTLQCGGLLMITNTGGEDLAIGDQFRLFQAGTFATNGFTSILLPTLATGQWDLSTLTQDGILRVVPTEPAAPPQITFSTSGGALTLTWPSDYASYLLYGQTNMPGQGLGTNWYPVGGVSNNSIILPIDPQIPSVFYRLQKN